MGNLAKEEADLLFEAILALDTKEECAKFFEDICTIKEIESMVQRLKVAKMLESGATYDQVVEETGASTATISRVKRYLNYGADGYSLVLDRLKQD